MPAAQKVFATRSQKTARLWCIIRAMNHAKEQHHVQHRHRRFRPGGGVRCPVRRARRGADHRADQGLRGAGTRRKDRKLLRLRPAGLRAGAGTPQHRERPAAGGAIRADRGRGADMDRPFDRGNAGRRVPGRRGHSGNGCFPRGAPHPGADRAGRPRRKLVCRLRRLFLPRKGRGGAGQRRVRPA